MVKPLVFVSLARKNEQLVRVVLNNLELSNIDYWVYFRDIPAGRNWRIATREAVVEASHFMVFLSPEALESANVRIEIFLARCYGKTIIPIMLDECDKQIEFYEETRWLMNRQIIKYDLNEQQLTDEILKCVYPPKSPIPLNTHHIFISYAPDDVEFAETLAIDLQKLGGNIWIDKWRIQLGMDIFEQRIQGIMKTEYLIVCLSIEATQDEQVKRDLQLALSRNIPIVPIITNNGSKSSIQELSTAVVGDELTKDILDINWIRYSNLREEMLAQLREAFDLFTPKTTNKQGIFISYRRADTISVCGRIYDRIAEHFSASTVYRDVINIPPGADFADYITTLISNCAVMLILIGEQWVNITDQSGNRRLDSPEDLVRIEAELGLGSTDMLVIPLLVGETPMPSANDLPESLKKLVRLSAYKIRHDPDFHDDIDKLINYIEMGQNK